MSDLRPTLTLAISARAAADPRKFLDRAKVRIRELEAELDAALSAKAVFMEQALVCAAERDAALGLPRHQTALAGARFVETPDFEAARAMSTEELKAFWDWAMSEPGWDGVTLTQPVSVETC